MLSAFLAVPVRADEPALIQKLGLQSIQSDRATLYFEKAARGDPKKALAAYEALLADLANRTDIASRADAMIDQVNSLVGFSPASEQRAQQRKLLESVAKLTNFMPKTLCVARQATIRDLLARGESIPNFTYDRASNSVSINMEFSSKDPKAFPYFVMPIESDRTMEQTVAALHKVISTAVPSAPLALHEVAEVAIVQRLHPSTPYFRWFSDGFANTIAAKVLHDQFSSAAADDFLQAYDIKKLGDIEKHINLQWWMGKDAEIDAPLESEKDLENARYSFATLEAKRLADKYGYDKIAVILTKASPGKSNDPRGLFKAIQDVTSEDMHDRLRRYQSFATEKEGIEFYSKQFNDDKAKGDLKGALSALLRARELRGPTTLVDYRVAGSLLLLLKQEPAANQMYQKLFEFLKRRGLNDQRLAALEQFCGYAIEANKPSKATDAALEVMLSNAKSVPALTVRMLTLQQEMRTAEARELASQILAIETAPNSDYRRLAEQVRGKKAGSPPAGSGSSDRFHL